MNYFLKRFKSVGYFLTTLSYFLLNNGRHKERKVLTNYRHANTISYSQLKSNEFAKNDETYCPYM